MTLIVVLLLNKTTCKRFGEIVCMLIFYKLS